MIKGTTRSGFKFSADDNVADNMELIDALADLDGGNTLALSRVCLLIFGEEQRTKLYDHIRNDKGRVPMEAIEAEMNDVMDLIKTGKKSESSPT